MDGITVTGHGEATAVPDTLTIEVGVAVLAAGVGAAFDEAARRAAAVIGAVSAAGVSEADIQTRDLTVSPEYDHRGESPRLLGYRVGHTLSLAIRNPSHAGDVLGAAASAAGDAFRLGGLAFTVEDDTALAEAARSAAWADARTIAEQLAGLADVRLGPPTAIAESPGRGPSPMPRRAMLTAESMPVPAGTATIDSTVTVTFAILPQD